MKSFRFFIFTFIVVLYTIQCYAQYEQFYQVDNITYITTIPNAELYELSSSDIDKYFNNLISRNPKSRDIIDITNCKKRKIKKPQQLRVKRCINTSTQQDFNAYVVEYKDKFWVLHKSYTKDNTLLRERNVKMQQYKKNLEFSRQTLNLQLDSLKYRKDSLQNEFTKLLSKYKQECKDSLYYYKSLEKRMPQITDSLISITMTHIQAKVDKAYNDWFRKQPISTQRAIESIIIKEYGLYEPNSVGGCDFYFYYINNSEKTIKYLYWTGTAYNRVNDPVICEIRRSDICKGCEQGPIESQEIGGGEWNCVIYNNWAETMKLTSIRIEYMDGTSTNINEADIKRMFNAPSSNIEKKKAAAAIIVEQILADLKCSEKITLWQERLDVLDRQTFTQGSYAKSINDNSYNDVWICLKKIEFDKFDLWNKIDNIKKKVERCNKQIEQFDRFINFGYYSSSNVGSAY